MIKQIWQKEMRASFFTWKGTVWFLVASLLFSFTSYLLLTNKELSLLDQTELMLLLGQVVIGVALLVITIDASYIITTEFEKETAESLLLSPISISQLLTGKLLASLTLWFCIYIISCPYIIVASNGSNLLIPFLSYTFLLGTLGIIGMIFFIFALSLFFRTSKNTLTTSLVMLLVFTIPSLFSSTLKNNQVALYFAKVNPVDNIFASLDNVLVDYQTSLIQNWQHLLPIFIFCLLGFCLLLVAVRQFNKDGLIKNN